MKKLLIPILALLLASPAWAAQQNISTITTKSSRLDLRGAINTELGKVQENTAELYSLAIVAPWLAQTTAPSIHNVLWVDTSGTDPVIKYWDGDSWEVAASGESGSYTLPVASAETSGGIKVGARLTITDGVLSADVQSGTGAVDSVNTKTGAVVINPDDLVDTSTTNKFVSAAQKALLDGANQFKLAGPSPGTNGPTYLQGGAAAIGGVLFRFPVDLPVSGTDLMTLDATTGQMGHIAQSTFSGWPAAAGIMVYGGSSAFGTSLVADGDAIGEVVVVRDVGTCSNPSYTTKATCESNSGTWTEISGLPFTIDLSNITDTTAILTGKLSVSAIDDTPVNAETAAPISSNWAYDHAASATAHGTFQAANANLTTWAGVTPGTGVVAALGNATGGTGGVVTYGGAIGAATATTPSAGDNDTSVVTSAFVQSEVDSTLSGTHSSPSTTNPLAPTWTGPMRIVWYGVTGEIDLPAASTYAGRGILIYNTGAYTVTIDPNSSEVIVRDGTTQTGGVTMTLSSGAGNYVALVCDGVRWVTVGFKGTLAAGS